jgi:hypothetical protein
MQENNNDANVPTERGDICQPDVSNTYSYQPIIPAALRGRRCTPPTGGSGVPLARNGGSPGPAPAARK